MITLLHHEVAQCTHKIALVRYDTKQVHIHSNFYGFFQAN